MPRIPPTLLRLARRRNRLLPSLLPVCRDLPSSQNELRWLGEHATEVASKKGLTDEKCLLQQYVSRRAKGEPLQYILGTEFFGELEIECRPGVLIPRQETAASVSYLAESLLHSWKKSGVVDSINVLDLCTGTGCIPLLFHHELFKQPSIAPKIGRVVGVDISPQALRLSESNKSKQLHEQHVDGSSSPIKLDNLRKMQFVHADILADEESSSSVMNRLRDISPAKPNYEVLISNPPYISSAACRITTAASVRRYEPKLALVPPHSPTQQVVEDGDAFYPKLYDIAKSVNSKVVLFEVADMEQACRVAAMAGKHWAIVEIWRDDPSATAGETEYADVGYRDRRRVKVRGQGNGRSVVAYTAEGSQWCNTH